MKKIRTTFRQWRIAVPAPVALALSGYVTQSRYNTTLTQQQALEEALRQQLALLQASLQAEINADQVKIEQLENGIRVSMSSDLLYPPVASNDTPAGRASNRRTGVLLRPR